MIITSEPSEPYNRRAIRCVLFRVFHRFILQLWHVLQETALPANVEHTKNNLRFQPNRRYFVPLPHYASLQDGEPRALSLLSPVIHQPLAPPLGMRPGPLPLVIIPLPPCARVFSLPFANNMLYLSARIALRRAFSHLFVIAATFMDVFKSLEDVLAERLCLIRMIELAPANGRESAMSSDEWPSSIFRPKLGHMSCSIENLNLYGIKDC